MGSAGAHGQAQEWGLKLKLVIDTEGSQDACRTAPNKVQFSVTATRERGDVSSASEKAKLLA